MAAGGKKQGGSEGRGGKGGRPRRCRVDDGAPASQGAGPEEGCGPAALLQSKQKFVAPQLAEPHAPVHGGGRAARLASGCFLTDYNHLEFCLAGLLQPEPGFPPPLGAGKLPPLVRFNCRSFCCVLVSRTH